MQEAKLTAEKVFPKALSSPDPGCWVLGAGCTVVDGASATFKETARGALEEGRGHARAAALLPRGLLASGQMGMDGPRPGCFLSRTVPGDRWEVEGGGLLGMGQVDVRSMGRAHLRGPRPSPVGPAIPHRPSLVQPLSHAWGRLTLCGANQHLPGPRTDASLPNPWVPSAPQVVPGRQGPLIQPLE